MGLPRFKVPRFRRTARRVVAVLAAVILIAGALTASAAPAQAAAFGCQVNYVKQSEWNTGFHRPGDPQQRRYHRVERLVAELPVPERQPAGDPGLERHLVAGGQHGHRGQPQLQRQRRGGVEHDDRAYLNGGAAPVLTYHRFWAQSDVAMANADYGMLFPNG
jgi:hypothetical protein